MSLFDDLLNFDNNSSSSTVKPVSGSTVSKPTLAQAVKKPPLQKQAVIPSKPVVESHKHPSAQNAVVQKVDYAKYDSEGCEQHYNESYSAIDSILKNEDYNFDYNRIAKAILLGEALAAPRSKKPWKPR